MGLDDLFENAVSLRKTVWTKRGDIVSQREVEQRLIADVVPRSQIVTKDSHHADRT